MADAARERLTVREIVSGQPQQLLHTSGL